MEPEKRLVPVPATETFGERLKRLRKRAGLSQERLAQRSKRSRQTVYDIERDEQLPSIDTAWLLADALELTLDELVGRIPPKANATGPSSEASGPIRSQIQTRAARRVEDTLVDKPSDPRYVNLERLEREAA